MDDRKLEVLLKTIKAGSLSKAALELHCTQSAVTQTMNSIEDELGCKILYRNHRGVKLTTEGETLLPHFIEADLSLKKIKGKAFELTNNEQSIIRIGAFSSISKTWIPELLQAYSALYKEVTFDIKIGTDELGKCS